MPTLPAGPDPSPRSEPHRARQAAESFGADPARYDRTRPRYPRALVERIINASPGPEVLDVGIGTGVSAEPFREAGCRVLGIEVDPRMAAFARSRGFAVDVARFEDWEPAARRFDAVIAGMTWHWIDPSAGAAKAAAVLRRTGRIAVFWNVQQPPVKMAAAFSEVYARVLPERRSRRRPGTSRPPTTGSSRRPPPGSARPRRSPSPNHGGSNGSGPTPANNGSTRCRRSAATAHSPTRHSRNWCAGSGR